MQNKDKLDLIFERQKQLQDIIEVKYDQQYINNMALALMCEIHEILDETEWKPWKKQQHFNRDNYKKELVDALHFFVNLCLAKDINVNELFLAYIAKNDENIKRQKDGY